MASGFWGNGECYATVQEAAGAWCARAGGPTAAGLVQCYDAQDIATMSGSSAVFSYKLGRIAADGTGTASDNYGVAGPCETYGPDYWEPILGAWVLALVLVVAAKWIYQKTLGTREVL